MKYTSAHSHMANRETVSSYHQLRASSPISSSVNYRQTPNTSRNLVENKIVDHSEVVGASPVGIPITSSFSTWHQRQLQDEVRCDLY